MLCDSSNLDNNTNKLSSSLQFNRPINSETTKLTTPECNSSSFSGSGLFVDEQTKNTSITTTTAITPTINGKAYNNSINNSHKSDVVVKQINSETEYCNDQLNESAFISQSQKILNDRKKIRQHPNIQHRPTIHPKNHCQRPANLQSNNNINNPSNTNIPDSPNRNINNGNEPKNSNSQEEISNSYQSDENDELSVKYNTENNYSFDDVDLKNEFIETEAEIRQTQVLIDKLNTEIFKIPSNITRPPSEYLEIYNDFTGRLHNLQIKKQEILDKLNKKESFSCIDNDKNSYEHENNSSFLYKNQIDSNLSHCENSSSTGVESASDYQKPSLPKTSHSPPSYLAVGLTHKSIIDNPTSLASSTTSNITTKPPIPPQQTHYPPQTPSSPFMVIPNSLYNYSHNYKSVSSTNSPATTPGFSSPPLPNGDLSPKSAANYHYNNSLSLQHQQQPSIQNFNSNNSISASTSSSSLPSFISNQNSINPTNNLSLNNNVSNSNSQNLLSNLSHNSSRSFGDINDPIITASPSNSNGINSNINNNNNGNSLSPTASMATTPTSYNTLSSSFLRIYIGTSTAVIEKKPIPLKDALFGKLKSRNLEIDKCIAYEKDTNIKIDWKIEVNKLSTENLVVAELSDEIRHSFEKKTFTFKSCDSCKKRFFNVYNCVKCEYTMCQRNECRTKSERFVCAPRKMNMSASISNINVGNGNGSYYNHNGFYIRQDNEFINRSESPSRNSGSNRSAYSNYGNDLKAINISQQILPVDQLKATIISRDRSRSETELNMFTNPTDGENHISQTPIIKHKINTNNMKINGNRNNTLKQTSVLITDVNAIEISGSIIEGSGSVIVSSLNHSSNNVPYIEKSNLSNINENEIPNNDVSLANENDASNKNIAESNLLKPERAKSIKKNFPKLHTPSRRDSFNSWEIPFKNIKIDLNKKIGSGSFGIVHQGQDFYHGTVAIKFLNVQNPTKQQSHAFRNEVAILKSTRHDNVLLFIGCILKPYLAIVTEWCPGSSLYRHIHVEEEYWEMHQLVDIAKQTATGMEYLHARDILHRDLKSNNIFLIPKEANNMQPYRPRHHHHGDSQNNSGINKFNAFLNEQVAEKWTVKIGDFGLATVKSTWTKTSAKTNQPTGSILWMAPEVITQKVSDPYTQKSDVYSYAVVLYELVTGNLPYYKKEQNMILFLVGSGRLKLNPDDARPETPEEIKDLIVTCSQFDRDKRLDFVGINEKLKKLRLVKLKPKLHRAQSVPNVSFSPSDDSSLPMHMTGLNLYEDDMYPMYPGTSKQQQTDLYSKVLLP